MMKITLFAVLSISLIACSKPPTAAEACAKLEAQGLAKGCHEEKPAGLSAAAAERYDFDLPTVAGKKGAVLRYDKPEAYDRAVAAYEAAAVLAGPHRYGSKKALLFVQANEGLSLEEGKRLKAVVEAF